MSHTDLPTGSPVGAVRGLALCLALPAAAGCAATGSWTPNAEETEVFTEEFGAGERLDLRNANGRIQVAAWEREEAEITARKVGPSESSLREMDVDIRRTSDGLRVWTRYPRRKWGGRSGSVHFTVRIPERADLRLESVNGPIEVEGVTGDVEAQTVNGHLRLTRHLGNVNAQTVNGRIECELEALRDEDRHSFRTVNGRVNLVLGPESRGTVDARAVNGRVVMELVDGANVEAPTRSRKAVKLGDGSGLCRVRTINGAIHVAHADN